MEKRTSKSNYVPILLHIVTSSSPTVLESSTMMVLTAPSNILIFWGFCFFLYSRISCSKTKGREKRTENKKKGESKGGERNVGTECMGERGREKPAEKMIKCIQVSWREGRIQARKPYLTAAYHRPLLPSNHNNEERFGSE